MIKKILFLFFILASSVNSQNNIEVEYSKAYKNFNDTTDENPKILKGIKYQLLINGQKSKFKHIDVMQSEVLKNNSRFIGRGGGLGVYYKDAYAKSKIHQVIQPFTNKLYLIDIPYQEYNWILTKETKKINNYLTYKAYTKYEYISALDNKPRNIEIVVWYTPEIPIPFGPSGYDGLPGLVLEAQNGSFYFIAKNINFAPKDSLFPILEIDEGEKISKYHYEMELKAIFKKMNGK